MTPRFGIFLLNLEIQSFCSLSLVHMTSSSFTESLSFTKRDRSAAFGEQIDLGPTSTGLHEFFAIVVMLLMTTNMASCAFEARRRSEDIVARTIARFTLGGHAVGHHDKAMTLVFDRLTAMTILILDVESATHR